MYKKIAALVLAAALLCSCTARVSVQRIPAELPRAEAPSATPMPEPTPAFTEEQQRYGSAALLTDPTVLVNVFLNDAAHGCTWDAEDRAAAVQRTAMAVDWINAQAAGYGAAPQLICDRSGDGSDAALTRSYLLQSAIRGGENSEESTAFLEEMDALCESLAADSRLAVYGARQIAFLFYLPISGTSFTMAHYADDGASFYYEYSCLYKTDAYTLLLPQGFAAQEGEDGGVTLSLDGQAVGGVQVVPYPDAAGFLDTVGAASEDSRDSGKELMRQLSPEERLAYMMTVSEDGTYLEISCSPDTPDVTPEEETMHYLFPQGDQFYDLYFQPSQIPADQQQILVDGFALHP